MAEFREEDVAEHLRDVFDQVDLGEEVVITRDGRPSIRLELVRRPVGLKEFLSWPKADRAMLDDIHDRRGTDTTDDVQDPWQRWAR